jgi:hypothetical protein
MAKKIVEVPSEQRLMSQPPAKAVSWPDALAALREQAPRSRIYLGEPSKVMISKVAGKIVFPGRPAADGDCDCVCACDCGTACDCICHCDCANCLCDCSCTVCDCSSCGTACACDCNCNPHYCDCAVCDCACDCIERGVSEEITQAVAGVAKALGIKQRSRAARFGQVAEIMKSFRVPAKVSTKSTRTAKSRRRK